MKTSIFAGLATVAMALTAMPVLTADAAEYHQNASGVCNGALPVFDQALRFRPLAVANTATSTAFISCSHMNLIGNPVTIYGAFINNTTAATASVSCSFVSGRDSFVKVTKPKTQSFTAGSNNYIVWQASADNGGVDFQDLSNPSRNRPAGFELEFMAFISTNPI